VRDHSLSCLHAGLAAIITAILAATASGCSCCPTSSTCRWSRQPLHSAAWSSSAMERRAGRQPPL